MTLGLESLSSVGAYAVRPDILLGPDGPIRDAVMTVESGRIAAIEPACRRDETIDSGIPTVRLENRAIVPGFIDTHHHVTEPFAKAIACGEPAQMWKRIWMPLEEATSPETAYIAAKWTFFEALRGGFTTVVDHGIRGAEHTDAIQRAAEETGVRLVSSTGVYDLSDFDTDARKPAAASTVDDALRTADDHVARTARRNNVTPSLACGTVQSNSGETIKCLSDYCAERGMVFQIHANEHTPEVHRCIEREGCRPIEYLNRIGALGPTTLIAHAALVTGDEIAMLRETDTAVSYNPVASQWKGNGVAPALDYARRESASGSGPTPRATMRSGCSMRRRSVSVWPTACPTTIFPAVPAGYGSTRRPGEVRGRRVSARSPVSWSRGLRRISWCWKWSRQKSFRPGISHGNWYATTIGPISSRRWLPGALRRSGESPWVPRSQRSRKSIWRPESGRSTTPTSCVSTGRAIPIGPDIPVA